MFEGGYVDDPKDIGGETKYGISKRAFPHIDIEQLTLEKAKSLYMINYWMLIKPSLLPDRLKLSVFDFAVNSGVSRAIKAIQKLLGVQQDGLFGPVTSSALDQVEDIETFVTLYNTDRLLFLKGLDTFSRYGKGWVRRVLTVQALSCKAQVIQEH